MRALVHVRTLMVWSVWTATAVWAPAAHAQLGPLPVEQLDSAGHRHSPAPLGTPGEMQVDVEFTAATGRDGIAPADPVYPKDALRAAVVGRARVWLDSLAAKGVHGFQLTPYGQLAVVGDQEALAQHELAQRVATPGLSVADRAFVLSAGATAFADREHPQWLPIAEHYLAQLTALGVAADAWQFTARDRLSEVYYDLDQRPKALAHAMRAYALLPDLPFEDHLLALFRRPMHLRVADILLGTPGTPGGAATMHAVDSLIIAMARPTEDRIQLDSGTLWLGQQMIRMVQGDSAFAFTLGHPGPPITGTAWINTSDAGPHEQRVSDGRIYLLDFFPPGAEPALAAQLSLERLQDRLGAAVQVVGITSLTGHWGWQFVDPQDEAQRWQHFFAQELKLTFPIAFWVKPKERTRDGGMLPPQTPTVAAYHVPSGLGVVVLVVDQQGRVRRLFHDVGRDQEEDIATFVTALEAEGNRAPHHTMP